MAKLDETSADTLFGAADKTAEATKGGGGNFIKLDDGESVLLVFEKRAPHDYLEVWNPTENRSEMYDAEKHDGMRPRGKYTFSVARLTPDGLEPALLDVGNEVYHDVKTELIKRGFASSFELTRKGEKKETKYRFSFEEALGDEQMGLVGAVEWLDPAEAKSGGSKDDAEPKSKKANPWKK